MPNTMQLSYNPNSIDAIKAVTAAFLTNLNVNEDKQLSLHPAVLVTDSRTVLTSGNAIVCRLLQVDPTEPVLCSFLLWENTVLQPAVSRYLSGSQTAASVTEIQSVLKDLERRLNSFPSLFCVDPPSACSLILWSTLSRLLHPKSPFAVPNQNGLTEFFKKVDTFLGPKQLTRLFKDLSFMSPSGTSPAVISEEASESLPTFTINEDDLREAVESFKPLISFQKPNFPCPKSPQPKSSGVRNILITSALPYVNNVPHLGNMIGSTLSASSFALYCDLAGYNVLSICGTDEYGTATETKAMSEQLTPRQICDKYHKLHCDIYSWFDIQFDHFGRTTTEKHKEIVQSLFLELWNNKYITEDTVEQLFCENCSKFLADRFIEGICPLCKYDDARGDQCDKCGRLLNAVDLKQPRCKTCRHTPIIRSSKHLFLDLPKIKPKLDEFIDERTSNPNSLWTSNARTISNSWLRDGLKPRCITRDLKWGVPVPIDEYKDKVFYVWFDAPIGYLSITANYTPNWRSWWQPTQAELSESGPIELFQFMAKDNVPFHAIIFPACLLAANSGHTIVNHLLSTEYMNYEGTKFSKSRGVGVFGNDAITSGIHSNIWRFYLLYRRPETQDSAFVWDDFMTVNNSELLNNLGNFVNRALSFVARFCNGKIPSMEILAPSDAEFLAQISQLVKLYASHLESCRLREGLRQILAISRLGNVYFQVNQPWVAIKKEETKQKAGVVIGVAANVASLLGLLLYPFMPTIGREIWVTQCGLSVNTLSLLPLSRINYHLPQLLPAGHQIGKPSPLFRKLEAEEISKLVALFGGGKSDVANAPSNAATKKK